MRRKLAKEKTLARAIYRRMEVGKEYSTSDLARLLGDEYYQYIPVEMQPFQPQGQPISKVVSSAMWDIVKSGYAETYARQERLPLVRGLRFGVEPTCYKEYTMRYWRRIK